MPEMLALMQETRREVGEMRQEMTAMHRQLATLTEQDVSARRELEQHRADDRRELDQLGKAMRAEHHRVDKLRGWQKWVMGGLGVVGVLVTAWTAVTVAVLGPLARHMVTVALAGGG